MRQPEDAVQRRRPSTCPDRNGRPVTPYPATRSHRPGGSCGLVSRCCARSAAVGEGFTSIWHRDPEGSWTFYETAPCEVACTRYFGAGVDQVLTEPRQPATDLVRHRQSCRRRRTRPRAHWSARRAGPSG